MTKIDSIVQLSQKYLDSHNKQIFRFETWSNSTSSIVQQTLRKICKEIINQNKFFKSNLYVYDENPREGIFIKSGKISVPSKEPLSEEGFEIHFTPLYNGKIHVYAFGHTIDRNAELKTIAVIDDLSILNEEKVIELFYIGFERIYKTSYLFLGDE